MSTTAHPLRGTRRTARAKPRPRRLWSIVTSAVLGVLVLLAILTVGVPAALGAQPYSVLTGSMRPGIPPGSLIAVRAVPFEDIRIGDIVTYQLESGKPAVVTHRVVGRTEAGDGERMLTTRGDANDIADAAPVREVQVRGVVVYAVPLLGYPGSILNGPTRSGIVVVAGAAVILYGVFLLARSMRRDRRRAPVAAAAALFVLAAGVVLPGVTASPASANTTAAADDRLLVSSDGENWVSDGSVTIFDGSERLSPGGSSSGRLWVCNDSSDDATATLEVRARPATEAAADIAVADDIRFRIDGAPAEARRATVTVRIDAGTERRLQIDAMLDEGSQNDSRRGTAVVSATIGLTQIVEQGPMPPGSGGGGTDDGGNDTPGGALPATGGAAYSALLLLGGAGALLLGVALRRASRSHRS